MLAWVALAGCRSDQCEFGSDYCDGDDLWVCEALDCHEVGCSLGNGNSWSPKRCNGACVETTEGPFCASSHEPDPICPEPDDVEGPERACDGDIIVSCTDRFATDRESCATRGAVCVSDQRGAPLCALSSTRDPRCPPSGQRGAVCTGDIIVDCWDGFALHERRCEDQCQRLDGGFTTCMD
jgi:hypothetical protein